MHPTLAALAVLLVLIALQTAEAGELGHFAPAVPNIRDYPMPAPGFYYVQYHDYYTSDTFRDRFGDRLDSAPSPLGGTIDLDSNLDVFAFMPTPVWVGDFDVLGGHLGAFLSIPFTNPNAQVALATELGFGVDLEESSFGLGDLFVQPVWLGWSWQHWDAAIAYGFYAPTGRYDGGANDNLGLGYWTNQFQATGAWYPSENRATALVATGTYEISTDQQDADLRPGDRVTLNLGVSQYLPLSSDRRWLVELGVAGHGQWQIERDSGSDASSFLGRDHIYAVGPQLGIVQTEWKANLMLRWQHELGAQSRFEGDWIGLTIAKGF